MTMDANTTILSDTAKEKLRGIISSIEKLEDEKRETAEQIKEVFAEAKALGYDTKALRQVIRYRKMDNDKRQEEEMLLETYLIALGEI